MPRFLAVYTMKPEDLASFRGLPKAEQDAIDAVGLQQWTAWENRIAKFIRDRGGMGGKTTRVTKDGISKAVNPFCGYLVVEAETARGSREAVRGPPAYYSLSGGRRRYHALPKLNGIVGQKPRHLSQRPFCTKSSYNASGIYLSKRIRND
ncbi:UNVERIFIED_ORG: hypothetical protein GGE53_004799 [Rhizobium etli]